MTYKERSSCERCLLFTLAQHEEVAVGLLLIQLTPQYGGADCLISVSLSVSLSWVHTSNIPLYFLSTQQDGMAETLHAARNLSKSYYPSEFHDALRSLLDVKVPSHQKTLASWSTQGFGFSKLCTVEFFFLDVLLRILLSKSEGHCDDVRTSRSQNPSTTLLVSFSPPLSDSAPQF